LVGKPSNIFFADNHLQLIKIPSQKSTASERSGIKQKYKGKLIFLYFNDLHQLDKKNVDKFNLYT